MSLSNYSNDQLIQELSDRLRCVLTDDNIKVEQVPVDGAFERTDPILTVNSYPSVLSDPRFKTRAGLVRYAVELYGGKMETYYSDGISAGKGKPGRDVLYKVSAYRDGLTPAKRAQVVAWLDAHPDTQKAYMSRPSFSQYSYLTKEHEVPSHIKVRFTGLAKDQ